MRKISVPAAPLRLELAFQIVTCRLAIICLTFIRDVAAEFTTQTRNLMLQLTRAISESLGLDGGRIPEALKLDSGFQMLVQNHYPTYAGLDGVAKGLPSHTDHGFLALIFQNGVDGLQVQHNGQWILVKPLPGAFFAIAGDQLEVLTGP